MAPLALLLCAALGVLRHAPAAHLPPRRAVLVEAKATPISEAEILAVLERAHVDVMRHRASRERLLMVWALVAFENGRGRKVFGNNFGNIGPTGKRARELPRFRLRDGGYYQAFPTARAGAAQLWTVLRSCETAMQAFDAGDGERAGLALRHCGYHRTPPAIYGAGLRSLYREALVQWPDPSSKPKPNPTRHKHRARTTLYATTEARR